MTIYIKRSVKEDGMPKKEGEYHCITNLTDAIGLYWDGNEWSGDLRGEVNDPEIVTHWLDPVELPSEEEIKEGAKESAGGTYGEAWIERLVGFIDGVSWLLNKLNSKGK